MDDRKLNPLSKEHSTSSYDNHMMFYSGHGQVASEVLSGGCGECDQDGDGVGGAI